MASYISRGFAFWYKETNLMKGVFAFTGLGAGMGMGSEIASMNEHWKFSSIFVNASMGTMAGGALGFLSYVTFPFLLPMTAISGGVYGYYRRWPKTTLGTRSLSNEED